MSSTTTATLIAPILPSTETPGMQLLFRTSKAEAEPLDTSTKRLYYKGSLTKPLQFVNVTKNPEIERKLPRNRRTVRSNAIKHAVQARKQATEQSPRPTQNAYVTKGIEVPSLTKDENVHTDRDVGDTSGQYPQGCTSPASNMMSLRMLWPLGTVAARTNYSELNLVSIHFQKVKSHYSIFSHVLDHPNSEKDLASVVLHSPVIYHATLYVAITQQRSCWKSYGSGVRNPLFHEAIVLRSVRDAISKSFLPQDEIIFAIALLGVVQLIFERSKSGATHLDGVAQMVRLRGGVKSMAMPLLYNLLEWLVGMHTLNMNVADDIRYQNILPAPFSAQPQISCHSEAEDWRSSGESAFMFLARRRIIYIEIAQNLQILATPAKHTRPQAHTAALSLFAWRPNRTPEDYEPVPHLDELARLGGLLYYRLAYQGGQRTTCAIYHALQLQHEMMKLHNEYNIFGSLYLGCSIRLCLILWVLYCGGVVARDEIRAYYIQRIRIVAGDSGKDWRRTKEILKHFAWDDDSCEGPMGELWRETIISDGIAADA